MQVLPDIGVIAPYKAQVALLKKYPGDGVEVDTTVYGFQGRGKQAIIMSTADNEIGDFVDDPQMLNVAVSRAKRSSMVVLTRGQGTYGTSFGDLICYIHHQNQVISDSQIRSVFDLLYSDYANVRKKFLNARGRGSEWDSENPGEAVVRDVLSSSEFKRMCLDCMRHVPLVWFKNF